MASGSCCPDDSLPFLQTDYVAKGAEVKVGDLDAYVVGSGGKAIVVAYDIYGFRAGRVRSVCDQLAAEGFLVVLPDFFRGAGWAELQREKTYESMGDWLKTMPYEPGLHADMHDSVLPYLHRRGVLSVGMAGFCWGAWLLFHVARTTGALACGVSFHPSLTVAGCFGGSEEGMARGVTCPQLLLPAGSDSEAVREGGSVLKVLAASGDERVSKFSRVHTFADQQHGYASRGNLDLGDAAVRRDVTASFKMALEFFREHV